MYTTRALHLRGNRIIHLSKERCSWRGLSDSVKWVDNLVRNLSSAAERFEFCEPGAHATEYSSDCQSNLDGFSNGAQNPSGFQQNPYAQNSNGVYENYTGFDGGSFRNDNQGNGGRDYGGFDGFSGTNDQKIQWNSARVHSDGVYSKSSQEFRQNLNGYIQNQSGSCGEWSESVPQRNPVWQSGRASCAYSNGFQQQNAGMAQCQNSWNEQSTGWGSYHGGNGQAWQDPNSFNSQVQPHYQGNLNWNNSQNITQVQQDLQGHVTIHEFDRFCEKGMVNEAVNVIDSLKNIGCVVDVSRLLRLAQLCGEAETLQEAKSVHECISASVPLSDVSSHNIIIDMYSNCGSADDSLRVFEKMPQKNLETWYKMIRCFAKNGLGEDAIDMFTRFKREGNKPDGQIFKGVFSACAVLGDINEGLLHFESMYKDHGIIPTMEHYVSVVEMLAAPGYLDEAVEFVEKMPIEPSVDVWETLMNLSRVHGDLALGDRCAELVEKLDATRLNEQSRAGLIPISASDIAKAKQKKKSYRNASGMIGINHFTAGDTSHPDSKRHYALLRCLKAHMSEMGYVPEVRFALHDVDQESKEASLLAHHEKLAVAQALLTSPARSPIRVIKNVRACVDCHNAFKMISAIVGREIVTRDTKRFHHMKDGVCTCKDYW